MELKEIMAYEQKNKSKHYSFDARGEIVEFNPPLGKPLKLVIHRGPGGSVMSMEIIIKLARKGEVTSFNDNSYFVCELKKSGKEGYFVKTYCFDASPEEAEEYGYFNDPKNRKIEFKELSRDLSHEALAKADASIFLTLADKKNKPGKEIPRMLKAAQDEIADIDDNGENLGVNALTQELYLAAPAGKTAKVAVKREFDEKGRLIKNIIFELYPIGGKIFTYTACEDGNNASVYLKENQDGKKEAGLFNIDTRFNGKEISELKLILTQMRVSRSNDELDTRVLLDNIVKRINMIRK